MRLITTIKNNLSVKINNKYKKIVINTLILTPAAFGSYFIITDKFQPILDEQSYKTASASSKYEQRLAESEDFRKIHYKLVEMQGADPCKKHADNNEQWKKCMAVDAITKRAQQFIKSTNTATQYYQKPELVFRELATISKKMIDTAIAYNTGKLKDEDIFYSLPVRLTFDTDSNTLLKYISTINRQCYNCMIQLKEVTSSKSTKRITVSLELDIYLSPESNRQQKQWERDILSGKFSGLDIAGYS